MMALFFMTNAKLFRKKAGRYTYEGSMELLQPDGICEMAGGGGNAKSNVCGEGDLNPQSVQ
jgi:hypothetical protein